MPNLIKTIISSAAARRVTRQDSNVLERERNPFATPIEVPDLASMFHRHPGDQTPEMREIVARQAARLF